MTDGLVKCVDCGLIVAKSKMEYHKDSGECLVATLDVLAGGRKIEKEGS